MIGRYSSTTCMSKSVLLYIHHGVKFMNWKGVCERVGNSNHLIFQGYKKTSLYERTTLKFLTRPLICLGWNLVKMQLLTKTIKNEWRNQIQFLIFRSRSLPECFMASNQTPSVFSLEMIITSAIKMTSLSNKTIIKYCTKKM